MEGRRRKGEKRMHSTLIFAAGVLVGALVGIFSIALLSAGSYDEVYRRGYRDGEKDRNPAVHGR